MSFFAFGRSRKRRVSLPTDNRRPTKRPRWVHLQLEALEERCTPAVHDLTTAMNFATIQAAVNAANPGDVILADAGTYTENVTITKALTLEGADHGQNANTRFAAFTGGKADPTQESVLTTPTNNPLGDNPNANDLIRVLVSGVTIDGFVIDGNNPALGASLITGAGGVDIHARRGITNVDATGAFIPINNLTVENNIIQNLSQRGVSLDNNSTIASTGNVVTGNVIRDFGSDPNNGGYGVLVLNDAYADVTNNTIIDDFGGQTGIQAQHFDMTGSMTFSGNQITVGQDGIGILDNFFAPESAMTSTGVVNITNNTVNAATGVTGADDQTFGIYISDITAGSTATLTNNIVGSSGGQFARGINLWDLPTANTVAISGGSVGNSVTGIDLDSVDPNFGAGEATTVNINNVSIAAQTTGILIRAATTNQLFPPPSTVDPTASVVANLMGDSVSGVTGLLVQGFSPEAITATATLLRNTITGTTGVQVNANGVLGAIAQPTTQNIILGNLTGIAIAAGAGPIQPILDNDLSGGSGLAINNASGTLVDASLNYFGVNSASGVAASVSANVDYSPFFDSGTNTQPVGTPGFNGDFSVLDVAAASPQAQATGRIQEGVNDVTAGGTVNVTAGTYAENVTINKNVTLAGAPGDPQTSIIQAAGGTGVAIAAPATTVTVKGVEITGAANGITASGLTTLNLADLDLTGNTISGGSVTNIGTLNYTPDSTTTTGTSATITAATFQRGTDQAVTFSAVPAFIVNGSPGPDVFDVTPNAATTFTIHGDAPTPQGPPPGDSLTVEQAGTTTPAITGTFDPTLGYAGSWTFGNTMPVMFDTIEELQGTADLSVSQTGSPPITVGNTTFNITITNKGPAAATNVILTDIVPAGTTFVSSSFAGFDPETGQINVGTIAPGASVSGTIVVNVPVAGVTVTNTASVQSDLPDPNTADNTSTVQGVAVAPATPDELFLRQVYRDLLHREIDISGLNGWGSLLAAGVSRFQVVLDIEQDSGHEYYMDEVRAAYQLFLHRDADPSGLNAGTSFLASGGTLEQLDAILAGSPEFFQDQAGGTNDGFGAALFQDDLDRPIEPSAQQAMDLFLAEGGTRTQAATNVLGDPEFQMDLVESYYERFLGRPADPGGLQAALSALQNGVSADTVIAFIIGSDEYFNKAVS